MPNIVPTIRTKVINMRDKRICVFCGKKPAPFRSSNIVCGGTLQVCCISCEEEVRALSELEQCRYALRLGLAETPEKLEDRIDILTNAEAHRHKCLRCHEKLTYGGVQHLDSSPLNDSIFSNTFDVIPAFCRSCGRIELFNPGFLKRNKYTAYLIELDTKT